MIRWPLKCLRSDCAYLMRDFEDFKRHRKEHPSEPAHQMATNWRSIPIGEGHDRKLTGRKPTLEDLDR